MKNLSSFAPSPTSRTTITDKKWLTINEAAQYIGMSVGFLRKSVRHSTVPYTRIGTKALRFDRNALDTWLSDQSGGGEQVDNKTTRAVKCANTRRPA
jgi:excisionase family DNA binding protein